MKLIGRYVFLLLLICTTAAPCIFAEELSYGQAALKEVFPDAAKFEPVKSKDSVVYYKAFDRQGVFIGVVFKAVQKGYSSVIETMAGMKKDGTLTAIKVLSNNETPGAGSKVSEPVFTGQFRNKSISKLDSVEAVTGATISSRAVIDSVKNKAEEIMPLIKGEK
jgi:electron transport complex protein RnfG